MGFDTSGNWTSDFYPTQDRDADVPILASKFETLIQTNLKGSFDNCILRDGTGKPIADISFNSQKITNLADGEAATDAVNKGQLDSAVATPASEEEAGTIQIATSAEALAATDDTKAMTPKKVGEVVRTLSTITPFCANSGNLNSGNADLISAVGGTISFKVDDGTSYAPLVCTPANSQNSFALQSIESYDASALADGTYVLMTDKDGTITPFPYQEGYYTYTRKTAPSTPYLWFDISKEPYNAYKYEGGAWVEFSGVPLAIIVMDSGAVDSFENLAYNENGFKANIFNSLDVSAPDYTAGVSKNRGTEYTADCDGIIVFCIKDEHWGEMRFFIDGIQVFFSGGRDDDARSVDGNFRISKGQTYQITGGSETWTYAFYPLKGAIK